MIEEGQVFRLTLDIDIVLDDGIPFCCIYSGIVDLTRIVAWHQWNGCSDHCWFTIILTFLTLWYSDHWYCWHCGVIWPIGDSDDGIVVVVIDVLVIPLLMLMMPFGGIVGDNFVYAFDLLRAHFTTHSHFLTWFYLPILIYHIYHTCTHTLFPTHTHHVCLFPVATFTFQYFTFDLLRFLLLIYPDTLHLFVRCCSLPLLLICVDDVVTLTTFGVVTLFYRFCSRCDFTLWLLLTIVGSTGKYCW